MPADRLSALDIAFLCLEDSTTPMHMGAVATFTPSRPTEGHRLAALVAERAARMPRLRLRPRFDPLPFGGARWELDPQFDPQRHVDLQRLGDAAGSDPLADFASGWIAEGLDTDAALWRACVVTGLPGGEFALLLKLHHALTDGTGAARLAFGLLDNVPSQTASPWTEHDERRRARSGPRSPLDALWHGARSAIGQAVESAGIAGAMLRAVRPLPLSPTVTANSSIRRLGFVRLDLGEVRQVRKVHGGTTNDVVLAVLAGALREWLINSGKRPEARGLRALVPVSVRGRAPERTDNNVLSGYLCELPVELEDPVERLRVVRAAMERNKKEGPSRGAGALPILAERLPSGVHRLAARPVGHAAPLLFDTVVTNVPLPGIALSLAGAPLREVYPFVPLAPHQAVGVAASTYRTGLYIGLQVNGDAVPDVGSLSDAVTKSLASLYQRCP